MFGGQYDETFRACDIITVARVDPSGHLNWFDMGEYHTVTRFTVWAGTSPALAYSTQALEIVATASGSRLWQVVESFGTIAVTETPSAVNGTPAVNALTNDTFLQAFQASSGVLWIGTRAAGAGNTARRRNRDGTPEHGNQRGPARASVRGRAAASGSRRRPPRPDPRQISPHVEPGGTS